MYLKYLMLKHECVVYRTDVSPCLATVVTTDRKTTAGLHGHSFAFSRLAYVRVSKPHARALGFACLSPYMCIFCVLAQV